MEKTSQPCGQYFLTLSFTLTLSTFLCGRHFSLAFPTSDRLQALNFPFICSDSDAVIEKTIKFSPNTYVSFFHCLTKSLSCSVLLVCLMDM